MKRLFLDTEGSPIVYNIGWVIVDDDNSNIIVNRGFKVEDSFSKLTPYQKARFNSINDEIDTFDNILDILFADMARYDIKGIWAYNTCHDKKAMNETAYQLGVSIPTIVWYDVKTGVNASIAKTKRFNKYVSNKSGKATLENVYSYLFGQYIQKHTALQDAIDTTKVFYYLLHRKVRLYPKHK